MGYIITLNNRPSSNSEYLWPIVSFELVFYIISLVFTSYLFGISILHLNDEIPYDKEEKDKINKIKQSADSSTEGEKGVAL